MAAAEVRRQLVCSHRQLPTNCDNEEFTIQYNCCGVVASVSLFLLNKELILGPSPAAVKGNLYDDYVFAL